MEKTLDDYKSEQSRLESRIAARKRQNNILSGQISRLKTAYDELGRIKNDNASNAKMVQANTKLSKVADKVEWRGNYKNKFDKAMKDQATPAAKDFFNSIDAMQDEIGRALDAKRGEYDTGIGVLNSLNQAWNNVVGIIRNWVN